jgi:hypothetical protein
LFQQKKMAAVATSQTVYACNIWEQDWVSFFFLL